jgi:hypothetical protein
MKDCVDGIAVNEGKYIYKEGESVGITLLACNRGG